MGQRWYVVIDGDEVGPATGLQLKKLADQGKINPESHVKLGQRGAWNPAKNVRGLFEVRSVATEVPPPPIVRPEEENRAVESLDSVSQNPDTKAFAKDASIGTSKTAMQSQPEIGRVRELILQQLGWDKLSKPRLYMNVVFVGMLAALPLLSFVIIPMQSLTPSTVSEPAALRTIAGLAASDVHLNFANKGFKVSKRLDATQSEWKCIDQNDARLMIVEAFGQPTAITMVRATFRSNNGSGRTPECVNFLAYVASLPYAGADPSEAARWIRANAANVTNTTIGGVRFEIVTKTQSNGKLISSMLIMTSSL